MDRKHYRRTKWLRAGMILLIIGLMLRLTYIQVFNSPSLMAKAKDMWVQNDTLKAVRGTIYDRNGFKLAYTSVAYIVQADLGIMKDARKAALDSRTNQSGSVLSKPGNSSNSNTSDMSQSSSTSTAAGQTADAAVNSDIVSYAGDPRAYAQVLSPLLHLPEEDLYKKMTPANPDTIGVDLTNPNVPVDEETRSRIENLHLPGIHFTQTQKRIYPNQTLAAHVLGFVGQDNKGIYGIEAQYNDQLSGKDGHDTYYKDNLGNPLPYTKEDKVPAQNGNDVYLTIDATLQNYAEQALDQVVQQYQPRSTSIIVADPKTGEILAMANRPTYDPNHYNQAKQTDLDNDRTVNASFEPGSTFKLVTLTAGITEHKINLDDTFQSGSITVQGRTIHDWDWNGWGRISFRKGVANSSNVGFVLMGQKVGPTLMTQYIHDFGYDQKTGIDLPDEAGPILFKENPLSEIDLATESFGQGLSVTPIQQVSAATAVANGGDVMKPYVMKKIVNPDTHKILNQNHSQIRSHVGNPDAMKTIRSVLEDDITTDETHAGYLPGFHVAGKTGTAQIRDPNSPTGDYYSDQYICSFIGFAPASDPKVEVYVTVDYPKHAEQFGNVVATPAAKYFFSMALPYLNVMPDSKNTLVQSVKATDKAKYIQVPDLKGMTRDSVVKTADQKGLSIQSVGSSGTVTAEWPQPGTQILNSRSIICVYGDGQEKDGTVTVPDLSGLSLREAADVLNQLKLQLVPTGSGFVVSQDKPKGSKVQAGTSIQISLKDSTS